MDRRQLTRLVKGAIKQTFDAHDAYLPQKFARSTIEASLAKRIIGVITGYEAQASQVRSDGVGAPAADNLRADR